MIGRLTTYLFPDICRCIIGKWPTIDRLRMASNGQRKMRRIYYKQQQMQVFTRCLRNIIMHMKKLFHNCPKTIDFSLIYECNQSSKIATETKITTE